MTDLPPNPTEPDPTLRYDPPAAPTVGPASGTSPMPSPTPAAPPPPAWQRAGRDSGRTGSIVFGGVLVALGLWFFADQTLGLDMPSIDWGDLWPLIIIGIGAWIVLSSVGRRDRG